MFPGDKGVNENLIGRKGGIIYITADTIGSHLLIYRFCIFIKFVQSSVKVWHIILNDVVAFTIFR